MARFAGDGERAAKLEDLKYRMRENELALGKLERTRRSDTKAIEKLDDEFVKLNAEFIEVLDEYTGTEPIEVADELEVFP